MKLTMPAPKTAGKHNTQAESFWLQNCLIGMYEIKQPCPGQTLGTADLQHLLQVCQC